VVAAGLFGGMLVRWAEQQRRRSVRAAAYSDPAVRAMIGDTAGNYMQAGPQRDRMMWAVGQAKQRCCRGRD